MSQEKHRRPPITQGESLYNLNLLGLGSASGHDWTSMTQEDCLTTNNPSLEKEGSEPTRRTTGLGILVILILCGTVLWILTSHLTQVVQQVNPKSIEQVRN